MTIQAKVYECFSLAKKEEEKGKKHKGLLIVKKDERKAEEYIQKAKTNLEICELFKKQRLDYKIPEEWFYSMYYCALAILTRFGVESRSQKCTALFLRYVKDSGLINYDDEFIPCLGYEYPAACCDCSLLDNAWTKLFCLYKAYIH